MPADFEDGVFRGCGSSSVECDCNSWDEVIGIVWVIFVNQVESSFREGSFRIQALHYAGCAG